MATHPTNIISLRNLAKMAKRVLFIFLSIIMSGILFMVGALMIISPGKQIPFVDQNGKPLSGSLSEKIFVNINGVDQGMFIKSKDISNPVLLYLHGGMPDYFLTRNYPTGLEDIFTVVWWEQRGSGLSYHDDIPLESITQEQLIEDTLAITNYLRARFDKEKIYLMGHSGGTFIGIQAAAKAPELYYAYIGQEQIVDQQQSEYLAYRYMLLQFKANGNTRMVQKLEAAPVTKSGGTPAEYLALRDEAMHSLGIGTMHSMHSVITGIFFPSLLIRDYTLIEKVNLWRAKARAGASVIWQTMLTTDLSEKVPQLVIPVYLFHGFYDYTCSYPMAKLYFEKLKAPIKGFYTFDQSAHSPMFEESVKMQQILREDVLEGTNRLADPR